MRGMSDLAARTCPDPRIATVHRCDSTAPLRAGAVIPCSSRAFPLPAGTRGCARSPAFPTSPPHRARRRGREPLQLHYAAKVKIKTEDQVKIKVKVKPQREPGTPRPRKNTARFQVPPAPPPASPPWDRAAAPGHLTAPGSRRAPLMASAPCADAATRAARTRGRALA
jgi:hypothetical protein